MSVEGWIGLVTLAVMLIGSWLRLERVLSRLDTTVSHLERKRQDDDEDRGRLWKHRDNHDQRITRLETQVESLRK